ncbi:MAG: UDP-N-acetylglucosamine 1-carboxyvinyltransferase [Kiritimatiellae bacterium]|nr:UDP-N-acetylglucosamine 1-carboxyvinyltransferase [Kiritimatiellia bacterium]
MRLIIKGQRQLSGSFTPVGNKNAALPMLAACLLTDQPVTLRNLPLINDVRVMLQLLAELGADIALNEKTRTATVTAARIRRSRLNADLCRRVRASILFAGPLTVRMGRANIFPPGGDVIGRRRVDTHLTALRALGVKVEGGEFFAFSAKRRLRGSSILLEEASVTGTENLMMAAVTALGETSVYNAACEPHVQDLGALLIKMGARIEGLGTNRIRIEGVEALGGADHTIGPDYIEAGSYLAAAAVTGGELRVSGIPEGDLRSVLGRVFARLGVDWKDEGDLLLQPAHRSFRIRRDFGGAISKVEDGIWPMFPSDLMSVAIVLATQARGSVLFHEKLFESRMYFVDRLIEMGARVVQCDPHRVVVDGPAKLHGIHMSSPDIRAGMAMLIAALCARGTSIIDGAEVIDRGYENVDERLRALGADVQREA